MPRFKYSAWFRASSPRQASLWMEYCLCSTWTTLSGRKGAHRWPTANNAIRSRFLARKEQRSVWVSGARRPGSNARERGCPSPAQLGAMTGKLSEKWTWQSIENEGPSGDVDENKERQVSGLRCQAPEPMMSRRTEFRLPASAAAVTSKLHEHWRGNMSKNEGSSGDVDENKERQVSGLRCRVSGPGTHDVAENGVSTSGLGRGSYEQIARTLARKCIEK